MSNFNVLEASVDLLKPHFLQASAGTGKTFAIEHIVTRLLLSEQLNASYQEILVVTFTRAATRELRLRIRASMSKALDLLQKEEKEKTPSYLQEILQDSQRLKRAKSKLEESLLCFDEMQIFTIHGFCQQTLSHFPFEAKLPLSPGESDPAAYQRVVKELIRDFLYVGLSDELFHPKQIHKILKKYQYDVDKIIHKLFSFIEKDEEIEAPLGYKEVIRGFQKEKERLLTLDLSITETFLSLAPLFKGTCSTNKAPHSYLVKQVQALEKALVEGEIEPFFLLLLEDPSCFFSFFEKNNLKKTSKVCFEDLKSKHSFFTLTESLRALFKESLETPSLFLLMSSECKKRVEEKKKELCITSPDDLLKQMQKALDKREFLDKVKQKYKAALIDEFQDTDPIQWNIFRSLFVQERGEPFPLFLVGDPKQSIYAFRNADLPTYLAAAQIFDSAQRFSLSVNYRSEPALIKALNSFFSASSKWLCEKETLVYEEVLANPSGSDTSFEDGKGAMHFLLSEEGASKEQQEKQLISGIIREILCLHQKGFSLKSFAILIRDRFQGARVEEHLKKVGLPFVSSTTQNLSTTKAFSFLVSFLETMKKIQERAVVIKLLMHPFFGFDHLQLRKEHLCQEVIGAFEKLKKLSSIYLEKGFVPFWDLFLQTCFHKEEDSFEKQLLMHRGLDDYMDLLQLGELLIQEHHLQRLSHEQILAYLSFISELDVEEMPSLKRRGSLEQEAITLMTIHKSKGLEFGIVFALGLCIGNKAELEVVKVSSSEKEKLVLFDSAQLEHQKELEKIKQEKLRQLYVALTRAKQRVYVPCTLFEEGSETPLELFFQRVCRREPEETFCSSVKRFLTTLSYSGISFTEERDTETSFAYLETQPKADIFSCLSFSKKFTPKIYNSYTSLSKDREKSPAKPKGENPLLPPGAETGIFLHALLEKIFERGLYKASFEKARSHLIDQETSLSFLQGHQKTIKDLIETLLSFPFLFSQKKVFLKQLDPSKIQCEMDFFLEEKGVLYQGIIDLCFEYEDKFYIVDWKSNYLGDSEENYSEECLKEDMKENDYFLQASLYEKALRKFISHKKQKEFGGVFYVYLRGLNIEKNQGIYSIETTGHK